MSTQVAPTLTMEQLETAMMADVVTRFANTWESTSRFSLLVKYEGKPAWQAIANLTSRTIFRKADVNKSTDDEEYIPTASAFEFCGNPELLRKAKAATTVVLHTLKQMFKGERKREGLTFDDFQRHVNEIYPGNTFDSKELKLGLYLAKDFNVLSVYGSDFKEVGQFRISESAISMANPDAEWDKVMATLNPRQRVTAEGSATLPSDEWEKIRPLGSGGQSDVYLVRSPDRVSERTECLRRIRTALQGASKPS